MPTSAYNYFYIMKTNFNTIKLLLVAIIIAASFSSSTREAKAQVFVPVFDSIHTTVSTTHAGFQDVAKMTLDTLAYTVAQLALSQITDSTVAWIKGGFAGNPSFAIDPEKLFLDTTNVVAGGLSRQIRGIATCNFDVNFNEDLVNMVEMSTRSGATLRFEDQIRCPFPSLSVNSSDFFKDFKTGGWRAFEVSLSDSGNPFGVLLTTSQELSSRQASALGVKKDELNWASGFISMKQCSGTDPKTGLQTGCKVTTPGKIMSDQLSKSLGTDMDRLGFADNMNKIVSALVGQLARSAINGIFN